MSVTEFFVVLSSAMTIVIIGLLVERFAFVRGWREAMQWRSERGDSIPENLRHLPDK